MASYKMNRTERKLLTLAGHDAPLYHWMDREKAAKVFRSDHLRPFFSKFLKVKGISLTRNQHYTHDWIEGGAYVRLTFDQNKLIQKYKITPVEAQKQAGIVDDTDDVYNRDRNPLNYSRGQEMAEEFLQADLKPVHPYLKKIFYLHTRDNPEFINLIIKYVIKWKAPLDVECLYPELHGYWLDYEKTAFPKEYKNIKHLVTFVKSHTTVPNKKLRSIT